MFMFLWEDEWVPNIKRSHHTGQIQWQYLVTLSAQIIVESTANKGYWTTGVMFCSSVLEDADSFGWTMAANACSTHSRCDRPSK